MSEFAPLCIHISGEAALLCIDFFDSIFEIAIWVAGGDDLRSLNNDYKFLYLTVDRKINVEHFKEPEILEPQFREKDRLIRIATVKVLIGNRQPHPNTELIQIKGKNHKHH